MTIDQCVQITLKGLPFHMWTSEIVEQLLSPYCAVKYMGHQTRMMEELLEYVCIACSQRVLRIPDEIALMVPRMTYDPSHRK